MPPICVLQCRVYQHRILATSTQYLDLEVHVPVPVHVDLRVVYRVLP